jgi:hypothetical protein
MVMGICRILVFSFFAACVCMFLAGGSTLLDTSQLISPKGPGMESGDFKALSQSI